MSRSKGQGENIKINITDDLGYLMGKKGVRNKPQYANYLLRYKSSVRLAIVEAKKRRFISSKRLW